MEASEKKTAEHGETRRDFLEHAAIGTTAAAAAIALPKVASAKNPTSFPMSKRGHVVRAYHSGATIKVTKQDKEIVERMLEAALLRLTGESSIGDAMKHFVKPDDIVGVKLNTLGSPYSTVTAETAFAVADAVHAAGVAKENIIIYDQYGSRMRKAKIRPMPTYKKPQPGQYQVHFHKNLGYEDKPTDFGAKRKNGKATTSKLAAVARKCTAVINVCVPKDHDLSGVTGAIKNVAYGNIDSVPKYHCSKECVPTCKHGVCNIAKVYSHAQMGGKVRLIVCDALRVLYHGGPQDKKWREVHNEIAVTTDPVAMDRIIYDWVDGYRKKHKLKPLAIDRDGRRLPRFIQGAADLGLGEGDLAKITQDRIELG